MSSRLCIKNLPPFMTNEKLRKHFSSKGEVTDVKILKTRSGKRRNMAFIGFKTNEMAEVARKYFDKSFIGAVRLVVETAKPVGEDYLAKVQAKHDQQVAQREARAAAPSKDAAAKKGGKEEAEKKEFEQFKQALKAGKNAMWDNDAVTADAQVAENGDGAESDSSDEYQEIEGLNGDVASGAGASDSSDSDSDSDEDDGDEDGFVDTSAKAGSDLDFLKKRAVGDIDEAAQHDEEDGSEGREEVDEEMDGGDDVEETEENDDVVNANGEEHSKEAGEDQENEEEEEDLAESGRLFVRNLTYGCTEEDLRSMFSQFGDISDLHMPTDKQGRFKGFAYITYLFPESAVKALAATDGTIFQGRLLHVLPARPQVKVVHNEKDDHLYKTKKEKERKEIADKEDNVWNALLIRSDTALSAMAKKLDMAEGDILSKDADNLAVRAALAETQIIKETKEFLAAEGIDLEKIEAALEGKKVPRSKTVLFVKNLPSTASVSAVQDKFARFGTIVRFVMPPSKAMAVIEFVNAVDAKRAFKSLAYTRFERVPLYLEWAPESTFTSAAPAPTAAPSTTAAAQQEEGKNEDNVVSEFSTLFVKNLNFDTTTDGLRSLFSQIGPVRAINIPTKKKTIKGPKGEEGVELLSMGFGFVEFANKDDAMKALKQLQGVVLDDHALELKISQKQLNAGPKAPQRKATGGEGGRESLQDGSKNTKLLVKNLAFEATRTDLRSLFGAFGQLKSVRIPRKFDGAHRGFGFVEFLTHQEAKAALDALRSTHLYGRHLVIQWAKEEQDISSLRDKAKHSLATASGSAKRRKTG